MLTYGNSAWRTRKRKKLWRRRGLAESHVASSRVFLFDSNSLIYYLSALEPYFSILDPMVERVHASQAVLYLSVVTELEAMVKPEIEGDYEELERIKDLLAEDNVRVVPLRRRLAQQAAVIRARHRLSTTDAIIVATAEAAGCDLIVGNDRQWRGRTAVPYLYLDDLNASP